MIIFKGRKSAKISDMYNGLGTFYDKDQIWVTIKLRKGS